MNWCLWLHLLFQSHKKCLFLVSSTTDVIAITNLATDICFWCIFCLDFGSKFDPKTIKTMARQPNPNAINLKFREQINNEQQRLEINWNFVWKENIALDPPSTNIYIYTRGTHNRPYYALRSFSFCCSPFGRSMCGTMWISLLLRHVLYWEWGPSSYQMIFNLI